ncbi:MAG: DUF4405 domain-containing protein [Desulfobacteraceae bacterium]|nr:MAG: DUF4405 domain-containing protein [Desulfobacteraceae bacterium]
MIKVSAAKLWVVNVIAFVFFFILTLTGLANWLLLPRGFRSGENVWAAVRHFLLEVHQWTALLFIISMAVHWVLHWSYIKSNLQRHGFLK